LLEKEGMASELECPQKLVDNLLLGGEPKVEKQYQRNLFDGQA
tara:strand:+ start:3846 stop:3974 length:129 start_codon:yes stop_codon:yes gene_type:complete